jgi:predicted nucleic acid-binding protein
VGWPSLCLPRGTVAALIDADHASRPSSSSRKGQGQRLLYLETSAVLAALLEGDVRARRSLRQPGERFTSALTFAEAQRSLRRARHGGRLTEAEERAALRALARLRARCAVVAVTDDVLEAAGC